MFQAITFDASTATFAWNHYEADTKTMAAILKNTHKSLDDVWPLLDKLPDNAWDALSTALVSR